MRRIRVENASKRYRLYHSDRPTTLQDAVVSAMRRMRPHQVFWALEDISFSVLGGHTYGVIGANGSGKSTLLRLLGGVMRPDKGKVTIDGRVGALLDLGAGFHPDLTGRENVLINGVVSGLTRRELMARFDSIVAFAELDKFIDAPLRTYSTGMQMRLAFAVAVHTEPDVLLIDEVLSVGDLAFQRKCLDRINRFKADGCAIVMVSHEVSVVRDLCDQAVWLDQGKVAAQGSPQHVVAQYSRAMELHLHKGNETKRRAPPQRSTTVTPSGTTLILNENRSGSLELEITDVRILGPHCTPVTDIDSGSPLRVEIDFLATQPVRAPVFQVHVYREDGIICYDLSTYLDADMSRIVQGRGHLALTLERVDVNGGTYFIDVGAYATDWSYAYDYHRRAYPLVVQGWPSAAAVCVPHNWEVQVQTSGQPRGRRKSPDRRGPLAEMMNPNRSLPQDGEQHEMVNPYETEGATPLLLADRR